MEDWRADACFIDNAGGFGLSWIDNLGREPVGIAFSVVQSWNQSRAPTGCAKVSANASASSAESPSRAFT